jgi:hypothetical protein
MVWRELRRAMEEREHTYYTDLIRRYPWPVVSIRAESPVAGPTMAAAASLCRRCRRVTYHWLAEDIGRQLTPDEQGALLRYHSEREPLACIVQDANGGLTGWYLRPEMSAKLLDWLCPAALGLRPVVAWEPRSGDEVIWLLADEKLRE